MLLISLRRPVSGTMVSELDNGLTSGQVRLQAPLNDIFLGPGLESLWQITLPSGYTPVITNGVLDVQERNDAVYETSALESALAFEAGVVLEMRAAINPGSQFVNLGFMSSTTRAGEWAYFSTRGTGDTVFPIIYTSVRGSDLNMVNVPTNISLGEMHDFKIVLSPGLIEFWVDGVAGRHAHGCRHDAAPARPRCTSPPGRPRRCPSTGSGSRPYNASIGTFDVRGKRRRHRRRRLDEPRVDGQRAGGRDRVHRDPQRRDGDPRHHVVDLDGPGRDGHREPARPLPPVSGRP